MLTRLQALQLRSKTYDGECSKHDNAQRWTGSGRCTLCFPHKRGTWPEAMDSVYGNKYVSLSVAIQDGLPCFTPDAPCPHGHTSWRYTKTPHICIQCVNTARPLPVPRSVKARPVKPKRPRYWHFIQDMRSGLRVSRFCTSVCIARLLIVSIRRACPGMLLCITTRKQTRGARAALLAMPALRLDDSVGWGDTPEYSK